jgi:Na+-driven multidrug efflux pump
MAEAPTDSVLSPAPEAEGLLESIPPPDGTNPDPDEEKLGRETPLRLLFSMAAGPFLAELANGAFSLVDSFWIGRWCGEEDLAAVSLSSSFDFIARAFGALMNVAASSTFAKLRGEKNYDALPQLFADLFRICFIIGILCPGMILPVVPYALRFFGAEGVILDKAMRYITPLLCGSVVTCLNMMFCGLLQSEGRSTAYGIVQVCNFILNLAVYDPLFLIGFKTGIVGAGIATVCSEATTMTVVAILYFTKKFDTQTSASNLTRRFTSTAWSAIKTGLSQFVLHLSYGLPSLLTRKYVSDDAQAMDCFTECLAAFNSIFRVWPFAQSYATATTIALLPSASFAVGAKRPGRVLRLFGWASLLSFIWCVFTETILLSLAKYIAYIFGDSQGLIEATVKMLTGTYAAQAVCGQAPVTIALLQAMGFLWTSVALSVVTQAAALPAFGTVLFFTDSQNNVFRLMWMYSLADAFSFVLCVGLSVWPVRILRREAAEEETREGELLAIQEGDEPPRVEEV